MLPEAIPCPQLVKLLADKPERIAPQAKPASARVAASAEAVWGVQLIGDDSQASALAEYYQLQKTYKSVLGGRSPSCFVQRLGEAAIGIGCVSRPTVYSRRRDVLRPARGRWKLSRPAELTATLLLLPLPLLLYSLPLPLPLPPPPLSRSPNNPTSPTN